MNKSSNCNNCGKTGHMFHQCKLPITSYGIILVKLMDGVHKYLMIRRKDSFGFIDFVRGKYSIHNIDQLSHIINEMSLEEKRKILQSDFSTLWTSLCGGECAGFPMRGDESSSFKKFELLKLGIMYNNDRYTLKTLIDNSTTNWIETEWEFPKGRRNYLEKDLDCALREFEEETGYSQTAINIVENLLPFEEIFIGSNHKSYRHKYFLAYLTDTNINDLVSYQKSEVSKIEWKTKDECLASIREYNLEKKQIIIKIDNIIEEYKIY